jgi:hypothetical protein
MEKHKGEENLIPFTESTLTKEEVRAINSKGGKNSVKARREKKAISALYAEFLAKKTKVVINGKKADGRDLLYHALITIMSSGSNTAKIAVMRELREALEGNKIEVLNGDDGPFGVYAMSTEEARARLEELRAKQSEPK